MLVNSIKTNVANQYKLVTLANNVSLILIVQLFNFKVETILINSKKHYRKKATNVNNENTDLLKGCGAHTSTLHITYIVFEMK